MDHGEAIRLMATEKYLLDELTPEDREQFEEHFFDCPECATDVRAGAVFIEQSKAALADSAAETIPAANEPQPVRIPWWRPAFAIPAVAVLLLVIGYQNLVTLPRLTRLINDPQVLPATTVNLLTYGGNASPLVVHAGQGFLVNVIVPPGTHYDSYKVNLHNPAGGVISLPVSASADDTWPIRIPGANLQSGTYKLTVEGLTAAGQIVEVGSGTFQLQIQE